MSELPIVDPAYNESAVLEAFHQRLAAVLDTLALESTALYVADGSTDETWPAIEALLARDARVRGLKLSRNFGKEAALTAGLDHVTHGAAVVIDADLQDPPELIPELVAQWHAGHDVVYATRSARAGETALKKLTAAGFYR